MIEVAEVEEFLSSFGDLRSNSANILTVHGDKVLASSEGAIVVVRKQQVDGYEFSGKLALPGGVVRGEAKLGFAYAFERSLLDRAKDETGLTEDTIVDLRAMPVRTAPVTRYTAKGAERLSLVFAVEACIARSTELRANRASIDAAFLATPLLNWEDYAPANRLILARALRDRTPAAEMQTHADAIESALAFCNAAAIDAGVPPLQHPWIDVDGY